jgi:membrane protease YdiL (CAAX protease family)
VGTLLLERVTPALRALVAVVSAQLLVYTVIPFRPGSALTGALLGLALYRWLDRRSWADFGFGLNRRSLEVSRWGLLGVAVYSALFLAAMHAFGLFRWESIPGLGPAAVGRMVLQVVLAAAGNEFLIRGYVFRTMDRYGLLTAGLLSVACTSLAQWAFAFGEPLLVLRLCETVSAGAVFTYIFYRTGSIWPSVILHGAVSAITGLLLLGGASVGLYVGFIFPAVVGLFLVTWWRVSRWAGMHEGFPDSQAA